MTKKLYNAESFELGNKLQVIVVRNKLSPIVSVGMLYKVGTADDPDDLVGVSHFLEHMMFKGTKDVPGERFKKEVIEKGGATNAQTSFDYTLYETMVPGPHFGDIIKKEADRMRNLAYAQKEVDLEKNVVLQERLMRMENSPFGQAYERLLSAQYLYAKYRTPCIGFEYHINNYTYQNTRDWYNKWYVPNNAVLIVCGNVTVDDVRAVAEKYFGPIPASKDLPQARVRPQDPVSTGTTQFILQKSNRFAMALALITYPAPCRRTAKSARAFYAYWLTAFMLGGTEVSLFHDHFVTKQKKALSISAEFEIGYDPQKMEVQVQLSSEMDMRGFLDAYKAYLKKLIADDMRTPAFEARLKEAKQQVIAGFQFSKDGTHNVIHGFDGLAKGLTLEEIEHIADYIESVTWEDVQNTIKEVFSEPPQVVLVVCPPDYKFDVL